MKNYTITEEQIKEIYNYGCGTVSTKLEELFPEAFEKELESGKWYKIRKNSPVIFFIASIMNEKIYGFGINYKNEWFNNFYDKNFIGCIINSKIYVEATDKEVEEALIKEAKRRYQAHQKIKYLDEENKIDDLFGWDLSYANNQLGASGKNVHLLFKDGLWADIIKEEITLNFHQIADKFGIDVEQLKITNL